MCPPGDSSSGCSTHGAHTCHELQKEPIAQNDKGWDGQEENHDEGEHPGAGIKNDVGPHDAGDGAAGSEGGNCGMKIEDDVAKTRTDSTNQVEEKIGEVTEVVFHIVAEDP